MTLDEFWKIVSDVHDASGGEMDAKCAILEKKLAGLSTEEIDSFDMHFCDCMIKAYTWELWAAAFIICGGCSDDGFMDFRATLISTGRSRFESAVASPDSLAEPGPGEEIDVYEGYQYIAPKIYKNRNGKLPKRTSPYPEFPAGKSWEEKDVAAVHPKLATKHRWPA